MEKKMQTQVNYRKTAQRAIAIVTLLTALALTTGCAFTMKLFGIEKQTPEGEKTLNRAKEGFEQAKAAGIPTTEKELRTASLAWWQAIDEVTRGLVRCEAKKKSYTEYCGDFKTLAKEIALAREQNLLSTLDKMDDVVASTLAVFSVLGKSYMTARMKDPHVLFTAATDKWKNFKAKEVQEFGQGSVRDAVSTAGKGECWFGATPVSADDVNFDNLQWVYGDMSESIAVGCVTNVNPDTYQRSGPDHIRVLFQFDGTSVEYREFPVNNDGSTNEYAMQLPLKPLDEVLQKRDDDMNTWDADWTRIFVQYIVTERVNSLETRNVPLARGTFFLSRKHPVAAAPKSAYTETAEVEAPDTAEVNTDEEAAQAK